MTRGDGWVPADLVWFQGRPVVTMVRLPDDRPRDPFLLQTLRRATGDRPSLLPLDEAPEPREDLQPGGFVFHLMRCGSTLVSRSLAALPEIRVLSEPTLFYGLLDEPGVDDSRRLVWLRRLLGLYDRGLCGSGERLFVKWSSTMTRFLPQVEEAWPGVPSVFMTRDPVEVLVSFRETPPGGKAHESEEQYAPHLRGLDGDPDARYVASCCYWACQSRSLRLLDYRRLPEAIWNELAGWFRLDLRPEQVRELERLARYRSKDPEGRDLHQPDSMAKQARAGEELRRAAARWVEPELARLRELRPEL